MKYPLISVKWRTNTQGKRVIAELVVGPIFMVGTVILVLTFIGKPIGVSLWNLLKP